MHALNIYFNAAFPKEHSLVKSRPTDHTCILLVMLPETDSLGL